MSPFGRRTQDTSNPAPRKRPDGWSYDLIADVYARVSAPHTGEVGRDLVERLAPAEGSTVLDVGTGTGATATAVRAAVGESGTVVGIDPSIEMLLHGSGARAAAEAIDLPFRDGTFDAETATFVIQHFTKYQTALFDMRRVLRPGGKLGVATWGPSRDEFDRAFQEVAQRYIPVELLEDEWNRVAPWRERFSDPSALKDVLHEAGFAQIDVERRRYRFLWRREDYVEDRANGVIAQLIRRSLGDDSWRRYRDDLDATFADRFQERFGDFREANLAVGVRRD